MVRTEVHLVLPDQCRVRVGHAVPVAQLTLAFDSVVIVPYVSASSVRWHGWLVDAGLRVCGVYALHMVQAVGGDTYRRSPAVPPRRNGYVTGARGSGYVSVL